MGCQLDVVAGEPHYRSAHGMVPWRGLRFWYEVQSLREKGVCAPHSHVLPHAARLKGVLASLPVPRGGTCLQCQVAGGAGGELPV